MIAIYGHPTRGNEVIECLKALGGNQEFYPKGSSPRHLYYINKENHIMHTSDSNKDSFSKVFTLEEYEKDMG